MKNNAFLTDDDHSDDEKKLVSTYFYIPSGSDVITVKQDLRTLQQDTIRVTVIARDGGTPQLTTFKIVSTRVPNS